MVWLIRNKGLRKPAALVGTARTGMLGGILVLDKFRTQSNDHRNIVYHSSTASSKLHTFSDQTSKSPSFVKLRRNQVSRIIHGSTFKKFDAVFLGSNSPIEDRFSIGVSENLNAALFSVIDGHRGTHCSQHLQKMLNQQISKALHDNLGIRDDILTIMDMDNVHNTAQSGNVNGTDVVLKSNSLSEKVESLTADTLQRCLKESFVNLDNEISNSALAEVKKILSGRSMTTEMNERIYMALDGSCALTALVGKDGVTVAGTGDCRVVLGHRSKWKWDAIALSEDQNGLNEKEVSRLLEAHPGEEDTVIDSDRVLGQLAPFRTFGDVDYKWDVKYLRGLLPIPSFYKTPPYVTAEPVMSQHKFTEGDQFLILATDGLWDVMSNQETVDVVAGVLGACDHRSKTSDVPCSNSENAATHLLWHALGGTDGNVSEMLQIDPQIRRMYRDDITIMIVYL